MSISAVGYPGCYPVMYENHSNPKVEKLRKNVQNEIALKQQELKVVMLRDMLTDPNLSKPEKTMLEYMLQTAQNDWAISKQKYNIG